MISNGALVHFIDSKSADCHNKGFASFFSWTIQRRSLRCVYDGDVSGWPILDQKETKAKQRFFNTSNVLIFSNYPKR